jgi:GSCFA family
LIGDLASAPVAAPRDAGIDGALAWARSLAEPSAVWDVPIESDKFPRSVRGRLAAGFATPRIEPKFRVSADDTFFCIGSCFARVIERQLRYRGLNVTSMRYRAEPDDPGIGATGVNKFTTASMLNEVRWSLCGVPFPGEAIVPDRGGFRDLQLADSTVPVSLERARERRAELREYFGRIRDAGVVIITLGIVEVWYDKATQLYLNVTPSPYTIEQFPGRFTVHVSDYTENYARLTETLDVLTAVGRPDLRIVVTVSPVPMHRTFTAADVLSANVYGKSTLRAVAGDAVRDRPNAEYFPSYELVTVSDRSRAYAPDQAHVTEDAGEAVARTFLSAFGLAANRDHPEFLEKDYLRANPDVRAAVAEGTFASGYEHWIRHGRADGRPLRT